MHSLIYLLKYIQVGLHGIDRAVLDQIMYHQEKNIVPKSQVKVILVSKKYRKPKVFRLNCVADGKLLPK